MTRFSGSISNTKILNTVRQRQQAALDSNEEFKLSFSKRIITAKIRNQITLLKSIEQYVVDILLKYLLPQLLK